MGKIMIILSAVLGAFAAMLFIQAALRALEKSYDLNLHYWKGIIVSKSVIGISVLTMLVAVLFICLKWQSYELVRLVLQVILLWGLAVLSITDYKEQVIPNKFLLLLLGIWVMLATGLFCVNASAGMFLFAQSLLGAVVAGAIFGLCYIISKKQLGAGDVKLAVIMGLYMTTECSISAYLIGSVLCCAYSIIQILRKKVTWKDSIPMVPFLTLGAWAALFLMK